MLFSSLPGQTKLKNTLIQNIKAKRLAHANLFYGKGGTGKLPLAVATARYIHCENKKETDACGVCKACKKNEKLIHPDTHFVLPIHSRKHGSTEILTSDDFIDSFRELFKANPYLSIQHWVTTFSQENKQASITIGDIRRLQKKALYKPLESESKVIIIWNVDKINNDAANSFLKFLEEPPPQTYIFLTTENAAHLLPTILSRCQKTFVPGIPTEEIADFLVRQYQTPQKRAIEVAAMAEGSIGAAIEMLEVTEQPLSPIFIEWMRICYKGLFNEIENWAKKMSNESRENQKIFLQFSTQKLRDSLLFAAQQSSSSNSLSHLLYLSGEESEFFINFSKFLTLEKIEAIFEAIQEHLYYLSRNANAYMLFYTLSLKINRILR
jgi:DNA polymerase-3 subunit delta'